MKKIEDVIGLEIRKAIGIPFRFRYGLKGHFEELNEEVNKLRTEGFLIELCKGKSEIMIRIDISIQPQEENTFRNNLPYLQNEVLKYFEEHPGYVFGTSLYGDISDIASSLKTEKCTYENSDYRAPPEPTSVFRTILFLRKSGLLRKTNIGRHIWVGLPDDIQKLEELGKIVKNVKPYLQRFKKKLINSGSVIALYEGKTVKKHGKTIGRGVELFKMPL